MANEQDFSGMKPENAVFSCKLSTKMPWKGKFLRVQRDWRRIGESVWRKLCSMRV